MSKIMLMVLIAALSSMNGLVMAANPDTGPGCGLGKILWADYANQKSIAPQVLMVTTNGTGMNTFAISSGTSGCSNDGKIMAEHKAVSFTAANFENLSQEMAQGQGEHLASLATLMGVQAEQQPSFFTMMQQRYTFLMKAGHASPMDMIQAINEERLVPPAFAQVSPRR